MKLAQYGQLQCLQWTYCAFQLLKGVNAQVKQNANKIFLSRLALSICLAMFLALSMTPAYAAISQAEAKVLMYQHCEENLGYPKEALAPYNFIRKNEGGWAFSLTVKDADATTNGLVIGEMAEDGQLTALEGPQPISSYLQLYDGLMRSERSYEAMYRLKVEWEPRLNQLNAEELAELDRHSSFFPFIALINHDIRLPADSDVSYEDARKSAEEAILASGGWTQEMMDLIRIKIEIYHVPVGSDRPVYQFIYSLASSVGQIEALYCGKSYNFDYDKLAKKENRVFGKALPIVISVRIDAQTGKALDDVYIEVPPLSEGFTLNPILRD